MVTTAWKCSVSRIFTSCVGYANTSNLTLYVVNLFCNIENIFAFSLSYDDQVYLRYVAQPGHS